MNIKFGMDNFYTRYLKRFLSKELSFNNNNMLGKFNKNDLNMLIQYLRLPNVQTTFEVSKAMKENFPELENLFTSHIYDTSISYIGNSISNDISSFIDDNKDTLNSFCESLGWSVTSRAEWIDIVKDINQDGIVDNNDVLMMKDMISNPGSYTEEELERADLNFDGKVTTEDLDILVSYLDTAYLGFTITRSERKNYFPNNDMLVFINQFDGTFIYNHALRGGGGADDTPHKNTNKDTKLGVYKCKPNQKLTIAHNSNKESRVIIGCTSSTNIISLIAADSAPMCDNVVDVVLKPGEYVEYTTTSIDNGTGYDAEYVLIQVPSNYEQLTDGGEVTITLDVGDINFDGKIDLLDYYMLAEYTATGPGAENLPHNKANWTPTPKQLAVMNVDTDSADINTQDAIKLYKYIEGNGSVAPLGFVYYTYNDPEVEPDVNNVSNILIIEGHYDKTVNVPYSEFTTNDWAIHGKFFNYLLNMAIHPYSDSENITYLQKLLKQIYPEYAFNKSYFYNGIYNANFKKLVYDYQKSYTEYTTGDLNLDGKLDDVDLALLEPFILEYKDVYLLQDYLDGKISVLSPEDYERLDVDGNGVVDGADLETMLAKISRKYSKAFVERADIDGDSLYTESDYLALQREVQGLTNNLQNYKIPFMLGYCDVETEAKLEQDANPYGEISEVSK